MLKNKRVNRRMNLLAGIGKRKMIKKVPPRPVTRELLERAMTYTGHLTLPESECQVEMRLVGGNAGEPVAECTPWYLLFFVNRAEKGLDAGYMVGQAAAFLRFQGVETEILYGDAYRNGKERNAILELNHILRSEKNRKELYPAGMRLAAILMVGSQTVSLENRRKKESSSFPTGICTEKRENWSDELLALARARYPKTFRGMQVSRKERWIHFSRRRPTAKNAAAASFEAGMAAANIMSAADELWVDLNLVRKDDIQENGYLFSVCRN